MVRASQDAIIWLFDVMESFFRRLESYDVVRPTVAMEDIIVKIMVEVLSILGIVTMEIGQGSISASHSRVDISTKVDLPTEKFFKKLLGRKDVEDALRRLDLLTQEQVHMAMVELLKFTHNIDEELKSMFVVCLFRLLADTETRSQFENGFLRRTRQQTTTLRWRSTVAHRLRGYLKLAYSRAGRQMVPFYGSTGNVRSYHISRP